MGAARAWNACTMTDTSATAVFDALVADITQHYGRGRILIAIEGPSAAATARFADDLADAIRAQGRSATRASAHRDAYRADEDDTALRARLTEFRKEDGDGCLLVDGRFLLRPGLRGVWHFRIWLEGEIALDEESYAQQLRYVRDEAPRGQADAIYDVTTPDAPKRVWSDSC